MHAISQQPKASVGVSYEVRRTAAERALQELLAEQIDCRRFAIEAARQLGDVAHNLQYVPKERSRTGACLRITFLERYDLEPLDIDVPSAWLVWHIPALR